MDDASSSSSGPSSRDILVELPEANRAAFKDPLGPVFTDERVVIERAGEPLLAIGDIVTASLIEAGRHPDVAVVDGLTKRRRIDDDIASTLAGIDRTIDARNPAGTITRSMVEAILEALGADDPTKIQVDGEEDLAVLPAVLAAPSGASVVYGQPDAGMVLVDVDADRKAGVVALLDHLEGDRGALRALADR